MKFYRALLYVQSIYTFITALWALVHIESFMAVTGPKTDIWLVKTVGVLLVAISACYFSALYSRTASRPVFILAVCSCLGLIAIDVYYTWNNTIKWVYLLDALAEMVFLACWLYLVFSKRIQFTND